MTRLSDLPQEISAQPIYNQIKSMEEKLIDLRFAREDLAQKTRSMTNQAIDKDLLVSRLKRTVEVIDKTPAEHRRPLFGQILKYVELHPMKMRFGFYAPTEALTMNLSPEKQKGPILSDQAFLSLLNTRGCSSSVTSGARGGT